MLEGQRIVDVTLNIEVSTTERTKRKVNHWQDSSLLTASAVVVDFVRCEVNIHLRTTRGINNYEEAFRRPRLWPSP